MDTPTSDGHPSSLPPVRDGSQENGTVEVVYMSPVHLHHRDSKLMSSSELVIASSPKCVCHRHIRDIRISFNRRTSGTQEINRCVSEEIIYVPMSPKLWYNANIPDDRDRRIAGRHD